MDEKDLLIVSLLQKDGRMSNVEIARAVELTPSATLERVRKLEERGVIRGYAALLAPDALDLGLLAFIAVRVESDEQTMAETLSAWPFVQELHHLAGDDCFLVKVRARDTEDLYRILRDEFGRLKNIRSTRTSIVLHTAKETPQLPVSLTSKDTGKETNKEKGGRK